MNFFFEFLVIMYLRIFTNIFQTFYIIYVEKNLGDDIKARECHPKKIKFMEDINDDELVLSSFEWYWKLMKEGKTFIKI